MSVTAAAGFVAQGVSAGIKSSGNRDVCVVKNEGPLFVAAGVFTKNRVQAAPVLWSKQALNDGVAHAVVLNSGGANACTGPEGFADTHRTAEYVAELLQVSAADVAVCSTGLIGERLPMDKLKAGIAEATEALGSSPEHGQNAAAAIMTTDTVAKTAVRSAHGVTVGGMAKGAGMLAPQLATMLVVITTDAVLSKDLADALLRSATRVSFDRVDSDACMSTNDTVLLLASGASGVTPDQEQIQELITDVASDLARQLIGDAEGASHDICVTVHNATTEDAAVAVAREICRSNLLKAAIFGNDPNWGRVAAAAGCVPEEVAPFDALTLDVSINGVQVCRAGGVGDDRDLVDMTPRECRIDVDLHAGSASATVWTNDLTHEYVHENSAYSS